MFSRKFTLAALLVVVLISAGCSTSSSSSSNTIAFAAKAYPSDGSNTCAVDEKGAPLPGLKSIESTDEHTVTFTLCSPDASFLSKLALVSFAIDDSGYLSAHGADGSIKRAPNGTGPFALSAWVGGSQIVLNRFDGYWGEKAKTKTAVIQFEAESAARLLLLQAGTVDGTPVVGVSDEKAILTDPGLLLMKRPPLTMSYIAMNNLSKPFDDVRVRLAVALSVNRQRLVDTFYPAGTSVAHSFVPCAITSGCAGDAWYEQDIAQAKELLAEAGFPNGFATTILVRDLVTSHTPYPKEIAQDLQDQLLEIGIKTKIEVLESTTWIDRLISGKNVGLGVGGGWVADYPDPTNYLDFFFRADSGGSARFGAPYSDVSEILVKAAQATDATKREALYAEANNLIKANVPMVPVVQTGSGIAYRADVLGANASPLELENLAVLQPGKRDQLVWVIPSEPSSLYCQGGPSGQDPLRICAQISESLYGFVDGSAELKPVLATGCTGSENGSTWTCKLRKNVKFHDGSQFDATDVVDSFAVQWDCAHPWRLKTESYYYFPLLSGFLNKASCSAE